MMKICEPNNFLESSHPDVELSFRFHAWKVSFGELLEAWMISQSLKIAELLKADDPAAASDTINSNPRLEFSAANFLRFFSDQNCLHPWTWNPPSVFMFSCLDAFVEAWEEWLQPGLAALHFQVNPVVIFSLP